ncbi:MAG TPA: Zn-dependent protease [Gammaproteobacteria bacterium]|nr:Zn-dependent protease [Gammaproteobacteria bacterium]
MLVMSGVQAGHEAVPVSGRPVHTYSIVARDPQSGQLGVAVQSHWFSVGSLVPWAQAGVGAIATQSFVEVRYGTSGLDLMASGLDAQRTLDALLAADPNPGVRQVAMIDSSGQVAVHTGENCIRYAGHLAGEGFSVQSNLMIRPGVPQAMAAAFQQATGPLAARLLAALEAAQAVGGDLRGKQSAAILVVSGTASGRPWEDRLVDLHVEDNPQPLQELRRLLTLNTAYEHMNQGDHALESGDIDAALAEYGQAEALQPDNLEMKFWHAVSLVNAGRVAAAVPVFDGIFRHDERWRELVPRLVQAGLLDADEAALGRINAAGSKTK